MIRDDDLEVVVNPPEKSNGQISSVSLIVKYYEIVKFDAQKITILPIGIIPQGFE